MNKKERVDAALRGEKVDRVPVSLWGHDFEREWEIQSLAEATAENFNRYDWDYVKVNPRASYLAEGWKARYRPSGEKFKPPVCEYTPIRSSADWKRVRPLEPDYGTLGEQLRVLQLVNHEVGYDAYFLQTIFCPLGVAQYLAGDKNEPVLQSIREDRSAMHAALRIITETLSNYAIACLEQGASGIFYATSGWAREGILTQDQYREFGEQYDLEFLDAIKSRSKFNVLHNCGSHILSRARHQLGCNPGRESRLARGQAALRQGRHGGYKRAERIEKRNSRPGTGRDRPSARIDRWASLLACPRLLSSAGDACA